MKWTENIMFPVERCPRERESQEVNASLSLLFQILLLF